MENLAALLNFLVAIEHDPKIGTAHISLYVTLFQFYAHNGFRNPFSVKRSTVMVASKINGVATYHKCMKDLASFGYIIYAPSYNPSIGSQVCLIK